MRSYRGDCDSDEYSDAADADDDQFEQRGSYNFTELGPGTYNLTATAPNFKTANLNGIAVGG